MFWVKMSKWDCCCLRPLSVASRNVASKSKMQCESAVSALRFWLPTSSSSSSSRTQHRRKQVASTRSQLSCKKANLCSQEDNAKLPRAVGFAPKHRQLQQTQQKTAANLQCSHQQCGDGHNTHSTITSSQRILPKVQSSCVHTLLCTILSAPNKSFTQHTKQLYRNTPPPAAVTTSKNHACQHHPAHLHASNIHLASAGPLSCKGQLKPSRFPNRLHAHADSACK